MAVSLTRIRCRVVALTGEIHEPGVPLMDDDGRKPMYSETKAR
jgi:hypothetical protein